VGRKGGKGTSPLLEPNTQCFFCPDSRKGAEGKKGEEKAPGRVQPSFAGSLHFDYGGSRHRKKKVRKKKRGGENGAGCLIMKREEKGEPPGRKRGSWSSCLSPLPDKGKREACAKRKEEKGREKGAGAFSFVLLGIDTYPKYRRGRPIKGGKKR